MEPTVTETIAGMWEVAVVMAPYMALSTVITVVGILFMGWCFGFPPGLPKTAPWVDDDC